MQLQPYLDRIGYDGSLEPRVDVLENLCRAQLLSVPFENFDIHLGVPIRLDQDSLVRKIIGRRRGGFCYELNGLFALLLRELGFEVDLLSARVIRPGKPTGAEYDHMALRVRAEGRDYLVDVGFGDGSTLPLELRSGAVRVDHGLRHRLSESSQGMLFEADSPNAKIRSYTFSLHPRNVQDFMPMARHHQISVRSWFTQARICVLHTPAGRVSLIEGVLRLPDAPAQELDDSGDYLNTLRTRFGVDLPRMPGNKRHSPALRLQSFAFLWQHRARSAWEIAERLAGRGLDRSRSTGAQL